MWRLPIPEFKVLLYGADLPVAGLRARAHFEPGVLVIQGKGHWFTVQVRQISLKTGGYDGRQWLIAWSSPAGPMTAMLQGEDTVDAFIKVAPPEISRKLRRVRMSHVRREWKFKIGMSFLGLVLSVPLFALGVYWIYADNFSRWATDQISIEQEVRLGDKAFEQMQPGLHILKEGSANAAVELIGARLAKGESKFRYRFVLVDDPRVNVVALPGGHVVVFTGLLRATESAEELAAIIAHEISHVEMRHTLRNMIHGLGWRAVLGIALWDFRGGVWNNMAKELITLGYSHDLELEADREGLHLLRRVGLPADGMSHFLKRIETKEKLLPALLASHPNNLERMAALNDLVGGLGYYPSQPLGIDWNRVEHDLARQYVK
jgi:beta-barrel assembly-enhancing protease